MKKTPLRVIALLLFTFIAYPCLSQDDQTLYNQYMTDCKASKSADVPKEVTGDAKRSKRWLSSFEKPLMGTGKNASCSIDGILDITRANKDNKSVGRIGVNLLVKKLEQGSYNDYILERIDDLPSDLFIENHKVSMLELAKKPATPHRGQMIALLALLNYEPALGLIRAELKDPKTTTVVKFKYHIFLARLGEEESITWLTELLSKKKLNDDVVDEVVPLVLSTGRRPLVQWVVDALYDPQELCYSTNPDHSAKKIHCGYRILEYLSPAIKDFPIKADESGLMTDNYEQALTDARAWFKSNPNYKIQ